MNMTSSTTAVAAGQVDRAPGDQHSEIVFSWLVFLASQGQVSP
jgi:hypothetical protein